MNSEKKGTIFVVDDDPLVRKGVQRLLKSAGYFTEVFPSAKDFLASDYSSEGPGCLILDVKMPGLSGFDLQEKLLAASYAMPIIFITGHGDIPSSVKAMKKGAVDFLSKPFEDQDLFDAISVALKRDSNTRDVLSEQESIQQKIDLLTLREYEILTFVITGMLNKQIAYKLDITEKTVKVHRGRVMVKMGVVSVAELVRIAGKVGVKPADINKKQK
jgi:FixJ family two-component response regulator